MTLDEFTKQFDEALKARDRGAAEEGIRLLRELLTTGHHRPAVLGMLGAMLVYETDDPAAAVPILRESVELSPESERGSLAYFHSLIKTGHVDRALAEAKRFLEIRDSEEYQRVLNEIASSLRG